MTKVTIEPIIDPTTMSIGELRRLYDSHRAKANFYRGLIDKKKQVVSEEAATKSPIISERIVGYRTNKNKELKNVYEILSVEKRFIKTGELCVFLNEQLEKVKDYNTTTFAANMGSYMREDKRFCSKVNPDRGGKTVMWGLTEWQLEEEEIKTN